MAAQFQAFDASPHVRLVGSFQELLEAPFTGDVNALCWPRTLPGDFQEIVDRLQAAPGIIRPGISTIEDEDLDALTLSPAGRQARDILLADQKLLRRHGLDPILDCVTGHPRGDGAPIPTDVYSFHVDSAPVEADTWLCTYVGASSEGVANASAVRRIDVAETRAELLSVYGGADAEGFAGWLGDHFFDLHYVPLPGASTYAFGIGNLWRIAIAHPHAPVPPCIHRAPLSLPGAPARLLLIS